MTPPRIVHARPADALAVAEVIARAFDSLAPARWLVPDPHERATVLAANFLIHVEHAMRHGQVHMTADARAVAVWFDRTQPVPPPPHYDARLAAACGRRIEYFRVLDFLFEEHHPSAAHHHLALLAVRPDWQGRGLGSALLRHHHDHLDRYAIPAYLEASSLANRDLYARHGYAVTRAPFYLPQGPPFWPMWRGPAPPA